MRDLKTQIVLALSAWVSQRPGLDYGNYGDVSSFRAEMRSIGKDLQHARAMINYVAWHDSITAEMILDAAKSGRLSIVVKGDTVAIDYCTGQYWPTEYRPVWYWMRDNMLDPATGNDMRRQAARELGTSIARRWFA